MMRRFQGGFPVSLGRGTVVRGQALLCEQFSTPNPSLRHVVPRRPAFRIVGELGHELALGSMSQEFLRWVHRRVSKSCGRNGRVGHFARARNSSACSESRSQHKASSRHVVLSPISREVFANSRHSFARSWYASIGNLPIHDQAHPLFGTVHCINCDGPGRFLELVSGARGNQGHWTAGSPALHAGCAGTVHGLDSYGAIPLGVKVARFAGGSADEALRGAAR